MSTCWPQPLAEALIWVKRRKALGFSPSRRWHFRLAAFFVLLLLMRLATPAQAEVPSLCESGERTVWSCTSAGQQRHSLCASPDLGAATGYLQYREGRDHEVDFQHPPARVHPAGLLRFALLPHGAVLSFQSSERAYAVREDVKGGADIQITRAGDSSVTLRCLDATDTFTLNDTIALMRRAGLAP
jgi:hypothetical protein